MIRARPLRGAGAPMKLLAIAMLLAVALVALPVDGLATTTASAVVCDVDDLACHERQARCYVRSVTEGDACPR